VAELFPSQLFLVAFLPLNLLHISRFTNHKTFSVRGAGSSIHKVHFTYIKCGPALD